MEQTQQHEGAYPVPSHIDAVDLDDNFRFNKDHFHINEKYRVSILAKLT